MATFGRLTLALHPPLPGGSGFGGTSRTNALEPTTFDAGMRGASRQQLLWLLKRVLPESAVAEPQAVKWRAAPWDPRERPKTYSSLQMSDVVVVGDINIDIMAPINEFPRLGGHGFANDLHMESGGSAANTAIMLGRLGLDVAMLGRVGDDPLGQHVLNDLASAGVNTAHVYRDPESSTGVFFVAVTPDGKRTMFGGRSANSRLSPDDINAAAFEDCRWLHLSGYPVLADTSRSALLTAVDLGRRAGVPISFDVGVGPSTRQWREIVLEIAAQTDVLLPNEMEAEALTQMRQPTQVAKYLQAAGVGTVALKLGEQGCYVLSDSATCSLPAFDIEAVDATGAGDAFDAGFIAGRLVGLDLPASTLLASALGALATTTLGAGGALPMPSQVFQFLANRRHRSQWRAWSDAFNRVCSWLQSITGSYS